MRELPLVTILKGVLIAGLAAGLTAALFHLIVTEPLIERAIALEEQRSGAEGEQAEPIVSRPAQKGGLVVGFLIYGLTWSVLLGLVYRVAQRWLPAHDGRRQRLLVALAGYWAVALFPFLKYPANPPGVGDPETIGYRQALYLAALLFSIVGTFLTLALARRSGTVGSGARRWAAALAFLVVFSVVLYVALPGNPDPVEMPAEIMVPFRALSLAGLTLFWAVLGMLFALLLKGGPTSRPTSRTVG